MLDYIWLIPVLPAPGCCDPVVCGPPPVEECRHRGLRRTAGFVVALRALACFVQFLGLPESAHHVFIRNLYTWLPAGPFRLADGSLGNLNVNVGIQLDPLSSVMLLVVTGIGFLDPRLFHRLHGA